jgi:hypothetical protein
VCQIAGFPHRPSQAYRLPCWKQILAEGDIDLQRNREQIGSIRRGEGSQEETGERFSRKERDWTCCGAGSGMRPAKANRG